MGRLFRRFARRLSPALAAAFLLTLAAALAPQTAQAQTINLSVTPGNGQVTLNWRPDFSTGSVLRWQYRYGVAGQGYRVGWVTFSTNSNARSHTITGLNNGEEYNFQLQVVRSAGSNATTASTSRAVSVTLPVPANPGLILNGSPLKVAEGATGTYTVALDTRPTRGGAVTVNLSSSDTSAATVSPPRLTFIAGNYGAEQTVTVTARQDPDAVSESVTIRHHVSGANYNNVAADSATVNVTDDDIVLTVKGNPDGGMEVSWSYSGPFPTGGKWQIQYFPHPQGGSPFGDFGPTSPVASTRSINISGFETGVRHAFKVRIVDANGNQVTESNWALATAGGAAAPTLISDPSRTVRVGSEGTVLVCYNLLSVIHNGVTYLEKRPGQTPVATSSELKNTVHGVEITEAPAVIRDAVVGVGNVNFDPCATVGPGVHSVTWQWNGLNGLARQAGQTTTTYTVLAANVPAKLTGFTATAGNGQVVLAWNNPGGAITGWEMQRKEGTGNYGGWTRISAGTSGGKLTHTVTGLTNGTEYGFKIRAVNANGAGVPSDEQLATPENKTITLSAASTTITEGNSGTKDVTLTVTLGQPVPAGSGGFRMAVVVDRAKTTATFPNQESNPCATPLDPADMDFCFPTEGVATTFIIGIDEGETRGTGPIRIIGDTRDEPNETIALSVSAGILGRGLPAWKQTAPFTLTIEDDDDPEPGVTLSKDALTVAENSSNTYTVKLNTEPPGNVTVTPSSDDIAAARVSGALTFTTANWNDAQTVTVTGVGDADSTNETVTVSHAVTGYGAVTSAADVTVTVTDSGGCTTMQAPTNLSATAGFFNLDLTWNAPTQASRDHWILEYRKIGTTSWTTRTISDASATSYSITGLGDDTAFEMRLAAKHADSACSASSAATATGATKAVPVPTLRVVPGDGQATLHYDSGGAPVPGFWFINQKQQPGGRYNRIADVVHNSTGKTSGSWTKNYDLTNGVTYTIVIYYENPARVTRRSAEVTFTIGPGVTVSKDALRVNEGGTGTYTVQLNTAPGGNVTVTPSSSDTGAATVSGALTFTTTNWSNPQTVTVTGVSDTDRNDETVAVSHAVTGYGAVSSGPSVTVRVADTTNLAAPAAPTGLTATPGDGRVLLAWDDPENASITGYKLRYAKTADRSSAAWTLITGSDADTTTHTVTRLENGAEYSFKVQAVNSVGDGDGTDWIKATPASGQVDAPALTRPVSSASGKIALVWTHAGLNPASMVRGAGNSNTWGAWQAQTRLKGSGAWTDQAFPSGTSEQFFSRSGTISPGGTYPDGAELEVRIRARAWVPNKSTGTLQNGPWSNIRTVTYRNDSPGVIVSDGTLTVAEDGSGTYTVQLNTAPGGNVTVTPSSDDTGAATVSGALTFTAGNWSEAQTVTVTGVSDTDTTDETVTVSHAVTGYGAVTSGPDVTVTVTDTTIAPPVLTGATSTTSGWIGLTWTHAGSGAGDYISGATRFNQWESSHRLKGTSSWAGDRTGGASLAGNPTQRTVRLGLGNDYPDGVVLEVRIRAAGYNSGGSIVRGPWSNAREVTYKNDDLAALLFTGTSVQVGVNATQTYTVVLAKAYGGTVSMTSGDTGKATVSPETLTFTAGNYSTPQTVTVTGVANGATTIGHKFRLTGATSDAIPDAGTVPVAVGTSELTGKIITLSAASTSITEGNSDKTDITITIKLGEAAQGFGLPLRFSLDPDSTATRNNNFTPSTSCTSPRPADADMCWGSTRAGAEVPAGSTTATWTFSIRGDTRDEGDETLKWRATAAGWTAGTLTLTIVDDDSASPGVTVSTETLTVAENGSGTYTVKLNTVPGGNVTVTPSSGDTDAATVSGALTFTTANWNDAQTVTVTGVSDTDATNETVAVSHAVSGYGAVTSGPDVTVTVTDTTPVLQLSTDPSAVTEGTSISLEVTSDKALTGTLPVSLTLADRGSSGFGASDIPGSLGPRNFDAEFGPTASLTGTVTIPTTLDSALDGDETYRITLNDTDDYELGADKTADGTLNEGTAEVSVPATLTVAEDAGNATVTITTERAFGAATTLTVSYGSTASTSDADATGAANPASGDYDNDAATSVQFGASDTTRDISIPITDDSAAEGAETFTATISGTLPSGFALGNATTTVTITDDDSPGVTASKDQLTVSEDGSGTYTVKLNTAPGGNVTVTPSSDDTDAATVSGALTFTTANWSEAQTVTVTGVSDTDTTNETVTVSHAVTGYGAVTSGPDVTVTVTDTTVPCPTFSVPSISSVAPGAKQLTVTWDALTTGQDGVDSWVLEHRKTGTISWTTTNISDGSARSYTITGLEAGTAYQVQLQAYHLQNALCVPSVPSDIATGTTASGVTVPAAPTGLSAAAGNARVVLTWDDPDDDDITGYKLRYGKTSARRNAEWAAISGSDADTVTYTVTGLENAAEYSFKVRAVNAGGDGTATDWVKATPTLTSSTVSVPATLSVAEDGGNATVTITTDSAFGQSVTFNVSYGSTASNSDTDATGANAPADGDYDNDAATSVTFGASDTTKDIVIPITDDAVVEGDETFTLTIAAAADLPAGFSLGNATTTVTITDDDTAGVTVTPTTLTVAEGDSNTYTVKLDTEPSGDVTVTVAGASGDVTVTGSSLTFTDQNYGTAQTVTVNAASDNDAETDAAVTLTHSATGGGYDDATIDSVTVTVTETTPVLQLSTDPAAVTEGTAISLEVTSDKARTGTLSVNLTLADRDSSGFGASDIPGALTQSFDAEFGQTASLTGTVTIPTTLDSALDGDETYTITLNDTDDYELGADKTADGTLNEGTATVSVPATLAVAENAGNATVTITTERAFGEATTITVSYGSTASTSDADATGAANPASGDYDNDAVTSVAFGASDTTKNIAIPLTNDSAAEGPETFTATIAGTLPTGFALGNATTTVTIADDDTAGVTVTPPTLTVAEDGSGTYTVRLNTAPGGNVTVTPASSDTDAATVSGALTFNTTNWNDAQTVTVTGVPDTDASNETVTVSHAVTGYGSVTSASSVTVTVTDTTPVLQLLTDPAAVTEGTAIRLRVTSDKGRTGTLSVSLTLADRGNSGFAADDIAGALGPRTFSAVFGTTPSRTGTVTIPTSTDSVTEGTETYRITLNDTDDYELGADKTADGALNEGTATVSVPATLSVTENAGTATVQVTASKALGKSVTFNVSYGGTATGAANPADGDYDNDAVTSVTFSASETTKPIAIPITDDEEEESAETITVTIALAPGNTLPTGFALGNATTTVTITDNDTETTEPVEPVVIEALKSAANLTLTPSTDRFTLDWTAPLDGNRAGWEMRYGKTTGVWSDWQPIAGAATSSYTLSGLQAGTEYQVALRPTDARSGQEPGYSVIATGTTTANPPAKPANLTATASPGQVRLTWDDTDDDSITGWQWQQAQGSEAWSDWMAIAGATAAATSHTVTNLVNGTEYRFRIRAQSSGGAGPESEVVRATPRAAKVSVPLALTATEGVDRNVTVTLTTTVAFGQPMGFDIRYGGTATGAAEPANGDYDNDAVTRVTFGSLDTTQAIVIPLTDDALDEATETIEVMIAPAAGSALPPGFSLDNATTTVTLIDDDASPVLAPLADVSLMLGETVELTAQATDADNDPIRYVWSRAQDETTPAIPDNTDQTNARLTFEPPAAGVYTLTVTADDGNGNSDTKAVTITVTQAAPSAPTNLTAEAGIGQVTLSWDAAAADRITGYQLRYGKTDERASAGWVTLASTGAETATHTRTHTSTHMVTGLDNGAEYSFALRAVNAGGEGEATDWVTAQPRAASVTLSANALTIEEGGSDRYTVVLDVKPAGEVTLTVNGAAGDVSVAPARLVFTAMNWATPQPVTVRAAEDEDQLTDPTVTLTHTASGGGYDGAVIGEVQVRVTENPNAERAMIRRANEVNSDVLPQVIQALGSVSTVKMRMNMGGFGTPPVASVNAGSFSAGGGLGGLGAQGSPATATAGSMAGLMAGSPAGYGPGSGSAGGWFDATAPGAALTTAGFGASQYHGMGAGTGIASGSQHAGMGAGVGTGMMNGPQHPGMGMGAGTGMTTGPQHPGMSMGAGMANGSLSPQQQRPGSKLSDLLNGASFLMPLGEAGSDSEAGSEADSDSPFPGAALWGRAEQVSFAGSENATRWDGGLWSANLGADFRLRPNLLVGAALSYARSDADATTMDAAPGGVQSVHQTELTSLSPYGAWLLDDGSSLWASAGYGVGEVRIGVGEAALRSAELKVFNAAAGGNWFVSENTQWIAGGVTRLAIKGEAEFFHARTGAEDALARLLVDTSRLRLALEGSHERRLADGSTLTPAIEAGLRYDGGDVVTGAGLEVGASLIWRNPASGLLLEFRGRHLVTHARDRDEWGVSAMLRLDPAADGLGNFLTLSPSWGGVQTGIAQLFDAQPTAAAFAPGSALRPAGRLEAEYGYGFGLDRSGELAVLSPYTRLVMGAQGDRAFQFGMRYRRDSAASLEIEIGHSQPAAMLPAEASLLLRGEYRW